MPEKKSTNGNEEKPFLSDEKIKILKDTLLKEYNAADVQMFLAVAEITRLDPFTRQLMARPERKVKDADQKWEKMILITGYTGFLTVADRSGVYDGSGAWEWCGKDRQWFEVWTEDEPPFAARVTAWRKDHSRPEIAVAYWKARAQTYFSDGRKHYTDQWANDGPFMLAKCAFAAALRRLFPSLLTGVYEESEFKSLEAEEASNLQRDVEEQKHRIAEAEAAGERLKAQGVQTVTSSGPAFPRDPIKEVEPAKGLEHKEPDDLDMSPADSERPPDWWKYLSCDPIKAQSYLGKQVVELSPNLLRQAVEKWVPKVRAKWDETTQVYRDLAEAVEIGWEEAQIVIAQGEAKVAAQASEGAQ